MICVNPDCPDRVRTGKMGEYPAGTESCPTCGARLNRADIPDTPGSSDTLQHPPPALPLRFIPAGTVRLATFPSYEQASFTAERLLAAGLHPLLLVSPFRSPVEWTVQFYSPTRLVVPEGEADEARALLEPQRGGGPEPAPTPRDRLTLFQGDITRLPVDAIVNAANETLLGGGGVDGAIHDAAGPELLEACRGLGGCRTGEAKLTHGYDLPARWVIHTMGPVWRGGSEREEETLRECYRACFRIAREKGFDSLAFPSISTGAYRYPLVEAARIAVEEILHGLGENPRIEVTVACFGPDVLEAYERALDSSARPV